MTLADRLREVWQNYQWRRAEWREAGRWDDADLYARMERLWRRVA